MVIVTLIDVCLMFVAVVALVAVLFSSLVVCSCKCLFRKRVFAMENYGTDTRLLTNIYNLLDFMPVKCTFTFWSTG